MFYIARHSNNSVGDNAMKKSLCLFLALLLFTGIFAGCTAAEDTGQPAAPRKIELTAVQAQEPRYVPIDEVGTYNTDIITDEIRGACTLGDISADALPHWTGLILENKIFYNFYPDERWAEYTPGGRYWTEDQIRFLAEQGFNCVRVVYSFSYLSDPDDVWSINMAELEQLDELLSWCMKYDMHMLLSITGLPGMAGADWKTEEDIAANDALFTDPEMQEVFAAYWKMLSRRYADISSGALSFELEAEGGCITPEGNPDMERFYNALAPIAQSIWEDRADRIVIVNDNDKNVPEQLAAIGCCLSLHEHIYNHSSAEEDWYGLTDVEHHWPMEYIPRYFWPENGTLKLEAESTFHEGTVTACVNILAGEAPEIWCDGAAVPAETAVNEYGVTTLTASVPEDTKEITIRPEGDDYNVELILVNLKQADRERVQLNVPIVGIGFMEGEQFPTFRVNDDGTVTNLTGHSLDGEAIYKGDIRKFVECAEKYHVGFIETEVGTDTTVLSAEEYLAYHETMLSVLKDHNIGWMYNCDHGIFAPKDLMWLNGENDPIPFEHFSQWEDGPYWVNEDVLGLLKEYE